jgi:hypothetical protein
MPAGDYATPVKISRSGLPLLSEPSGLSTARPYAPAEIDQKLLAVGTTYAYSTPNTPVSAMKFQEVGTQDRRRTLISGKSLLTGEATNINSTVVSGIVPSQPGSSYGGLHNFPRFIENWKKDNATLDYVGSFLQLSFSNYATAPFQMVGWERDAAGTFIPPLQTVGSNQESLHYYDAPVRQWGYDVALQLAPAGPVASRFVVLKAPRNEFYSEPQINDPYIQNLCAVAKANETATEFKGAANLNCTN